MTLPSTEKKVQEITSTHVCQSLMDHVCQSLMDEVTKRTSDILLQFAITTTKDLDIKSVYHTVYKYVYLPMFHCSQKSDILRTLKQYDFSK